MARYLVVDGTRFEFGDDERFAQIVQRVKDDPQNQLVIIGCVRCKVVCVGIGRRDDLSCTCCHNYASSHGGGKTYFHEDGKGHERLMSREEFLARLERAA